MRYPALRQWYWTPWRIARPNSARDAASLYTLIYPERHLQERLYSFLPFLARHGLDLIGRIYEAIDLECADHRLMVI